MSTYKPKVHQELPKKYMNLPKDFSVLDYLNSANAIVHSGLEEYIDCKGFSMETFYLYKKLIKENKRKDLSDKIRLSFGLMKNEGHMQIEFEEAGVFYPFESAINTPNLGIFKIKEYSIKTRKEKTLNNLQKRWGFTMGTDKTFIPTLESFIYPGGIIRAYYLLAKENIEEPYLPSELSLN